MRAKVDDDQVEHKNRQAPAALHQHAAPPTPRVPRARQADPLGERPGPFEPIERDLSPPVAAIRPRSRSSRRASQLSLMAARNPMQEGPARTVP
jgi:hypothetical protein